MRYSNRVNSQVRSHIHSLSEWSATQWQRYTVTRKVLKQRLVVFAFKVKDKVSKGATFTLKTNLDTQFQYCSANSICLPCKCQETVAIGY